MEFVNVFEKLKYRFIIGRYQFDLEKYIPIKLQLITNTSPILLEYPYNCNAISCDKIINGALEKIVTLERNSATVVAATSATADLNTGISANNEYIIQKYPEITTGFVTKLAGRAQIEWNPFICKIEKRIFNKTNKWWYLIVNDGEKSHRVAIASQCFYLFENDLVKKDDYIYVQYYTATKISGNKSKVLFFTKFYKIDPITTLQLS